MMCIDCINEDSANMTLGILSSRLTFWLWHVLSDAFHVPRWFIEIIPFGKSSFSVSHARRLSICGAQLWQRICEQPIVSLNRGRQTVAYRPLSCEEERDELDSILLECAGIPAAMSDELREFVRNTVVIDTDDRRRQSVASHFIAKEVTI